MDLISSSNPSRNMTVTFIYVLKCVRFVFKNYKDVLVNCEPNHRYVTHWSNKIVLKASQTTYQLLSMRIFNLIHVSDSSKVLDNK